MESPSDDGQEDGERYEAGESRTMFTERDGNQEEE
jgi:hypothetical protein